METRIDLAIRCGEEKLCGSIYKALVPEINSLPERCRGKISGGGSVVNISIECRRPNHLRAVVNSLLPIIASMLESI